MSNYANFHTFEKVTITSLFGDRREFWSKTRTYPSQPENTPACQNKPWGWGSCSFFNQFCKYKHTRFKVFLYFLVAVDAISYTYTIGIDSVDEFLFCREPDTAIQLSTLKWRRMGTVRYFSNPLDLITQGSILTYTNSQPMECINTANNQSILRVGLIFQGFI